MASTAVDKLQQGSELAASTKLLLVTATVAVMYIGFPLSATRSPGGWASYAFVGGSRQELARFFADTGPVESGITRDGKPTYGDPFAKGANRGPLLPVYQLELPRKVSANEPIPGFVRLKDRASGWLVIACVGTGCAYRVPIIYTEAMLDSVRLVMAIATGTFEAENADEELKGLEAAAVQMEHLLATKLTTLTTGELEAYRVKGANLDPWTQDCIDQAANGTSYAIVWAEDQLMRFHRPYYPGFNPGALPHFYSRLQRLQDRQVFAFDLYHRSDGIGRGSPIRSMLDPRKGT